MKPNDPKILGVFKELDLIAQEIHIKLGGEHPAGGSEIYVVDGDPDVTETMTCTDMVCSTSEAKFPGRIESFTVEVMEDVLCEPEMSMKLIAALVYQQSFRYLDRLDYLDLPE